MDSMQATSYQYINVIPYSNLINWSVNYHLERDHGYNEDYELVNIGSVITRNRQKIELQEEELYTQVTIKLWGKGVVERTKKYGKEIGTKNQYRVSEGQFIMSKIDARNGAFGIVPAELEDAITTQDFLSYNINSDKVNPKFLKILSSTDQFLKICQSASTGTTGRRRIDEKFFLSIPIPLPSLEEQQQIVKAYNEKVDEADSLKDQTLSVKKDYIDLLSKKLGVEFGKSEVNRSKLKYIKYSNLHRWGISNTQIYQSNFPLVEVGSCLTDISTGTTPPTKRKEYFDGEVPFFTPADLTDIDYLKESKRTLTALAIQDGKARVFPKGTLLFVGIGSSIGKVGLVDIQIATSNQQITGIAFNEDIMLSEFAFIFFHHFQSITTADKVQSTLPIINQEKIKAILMPKPPISFQKQIILEYKSYSKKLSNLIKEESTYRKNALSNFESQIFKSQ